VLARLLEKRNPQEQARTKYNSALKLRGARLQALDNLESQISAPLPEGCGQGSATAHRRFFGKIDQPFSIFQKAPKNIAEAEARRADHQLHH
jgi:hypothetical protein